MNAAGQPCENNSSNETGAFCAMTTPTGIPPAKLRARPMPKPDRPEPAVPRKKPEAPDVAADPAVSMPARGTVYLDAGRGDLQRSDAVASTTAPTVVGHSGWTDVEQMQAELVSVQAEVEAAERMLEAARLLPGSAGWPHDAKRIPNANLGRPFSEFDEDLDQAGKSNEEYRDGRTYTNNDDVSLSRRRLWTGQYRIRDRRASGPHSTEHIPKSGSNLNASGEQRPVADVHCIIEDSNGNVIRTLKGKVGKNCSELIASLLENEPNIFDRLGVDEEGNSRVSLGAGLRDFMYAFGRRAAVQGNNLAVFVDGAGVRQNLSDGNGNSIYYNPLNGKFFPNSADLEINDALILSSLGITGNLRRVPFKKIASRTDSPSRLSVSADTPVTKNAETVRFHSREFPGEGAAGKNSSPVLERNTKRSVFSQTEVPEFGSIACGPTACAMILSDRGIMANIPDIMRGATFTENGTRVTDLARIMREHGILHSRDALQSTIADVDHATRKGHAAIVHVRNPAKPDERGHFVVVDGVTKRQGRRVVAIREPADGSQFFVDEEFFAWRMSGNTVFTNPIK